MSSEGLQSELCDEKVNLTSVYKVDGMGRGQSLEASRKAVVVACGKTDGSCFKVCVVGWEGGGARSRGLAEQEAGLGHDACWRTPWGCSEALSPGHSLVGECSEENSARPGP